MQVDNEKYQVQLDFALRLAHWESGEPNLLTKSKVAQKYRGREYHSKVRRVMADFKGAPRKVVCNPGKTALGPKLAEYAKEGIEHVTDANDYGFPVYLERAALSAYVACRGWIKDEYDPLVGDMVFSNPDPRRMFLAHGYKDVWDRRLPYLIEQVPMALVEARERWPDAQLHSDFTGSDLAYPIATVAVGPRPEPDPNDEGYVLVLICYSQFDRTKQRQRMGGRNLRPNEMYAYCPECQKPAPPEMQGQMCPECLKSPGTANPMKLAMSEEHHGDGPKYPMGRRLEFIAPLQSKVLEDRGWPTDRNGNTLRMPPYVLLRRGEHPSEFAAISETAVDAPMQTLSNALMERARVTVQSAGSVIATTAGIKDAAGNDFHLTDAPVQFAHLDDITGKMEQFNFELPSSILNLYGAVQESFRGDMGYTELSTQGASQIKGVQVGVAEAAVEAGAIPTKDFIKSCFRSLGPFYGVIHDWQRIIWTEEDWARVLGEEQGALAYELMGHESAPNADFTLSGTNDRAMLDAEQINKVMAWYGTGNPMTGGSPELRDVLGTVSGIDPDLMNRLNEAEQEAQEEMQATAEAAALKGQPGKTPKGPEAGGPMGNGAAPPVPTGIPAQRSMA